MKRPQHTLAPAAAAAAIALALLPSPRAGYAEAGSTQPNPIQLENALPGTSAGLLPNSAVAGSIEGYASEVSALPGQTLHLHVSTNPAAPYRVEVYRLGSYGGAGSRLIGCTPTCTSLHGGQPLPRPAPGADGLLRADWPVTDTFTLPPDATSGYFSIRFVLGSGQSSATWVVVRAAAGDRASILVQVPVNTWQAYNNWGGNSLYGMPGVAPANRVSFDRPYAWNPLGWEYPLVLFLEQSGYDVSYQTDYDTDQDPNSLLGHRLVIVNGHGEYWTGAMRAAFEAARDSGVNLAFMGSNDVYWRARYDDSGRTLVVYKFGGDPVTDPSQTTGLFRAVDRPECQLIGIQHQGGKLNWPTGDYTVVSSSLGHPWFAGTGFTEGSVAGGLVSVETDTIPADGGAGCGHELTVFFHHEGGGDEFGNADTTAYTAPSGAVVFAAGSELFSWGLADAPAVTGNAHGLVDPRLQIFMHNVLDDLSATRVVDLGVQLSPPTAQAAAGKIVRIRAVVSNSGPDSADAGLLDVTLPPGLRFVRVAGTAVRCAITPLRCRLTHIPAGSSVSAVFTVRVVKAGRQTVSAHAFTLIATDSDPGNATANSEVLCRNPPPDAVAASG